MHNRLAGESSPYLLQHAANPVDWYPWGEEAFAHARDRDVPVFLSIGYSACHWCHVMERESFTDPDTAEYLNAHFVCVKVDREERPDVDAIYMQAVTALTGQGGWPLSAWLTPDGAPFHAGTYYPPRPAFGRPSFRQVLEAIQSVWKTRRNELDRAARRIVEHLGREDAAGSPGVSRAQLLAAATAELLEGADEVHGGWGDAPKFPQPLVLEYLLAAHAVSPGRSLHKVVTITLDAMAAGGIYDQLGGGFHRYSTDNTWLVPHFEKMLYDNAQLARCYLHAWQATAKSHYRRIAEETLDYLLRRMRHPLGGFFSAEDADSEGREGAYYVWTPEQMRRVLGASDSMRCEAVFGVTAQGNFEGASILHLPAGPDAEQELPATSRSKLLSAREERVPPARDDKVLTGWNGLALAALAEAARAFGSSRFRDAAVATGEFMVRELFRSDDRVYHSWKEGVAAVNGFLDDYACMIEGLLALYQATYDERWFETARRLTDAMIAHFHRPAGGFYDTSDDHESLIVRPRSLQDSPTASGNAIAATVLLKMAAYTGEPPYSELAEETLASAGAFVPLAPVMAGQWLTANLLADTGFTEVAVVGDLAGPVAKRMLAVVDSTFRPNLAPAAKQTGVASVLPLLHGREPGPHTETAAWVCRASSCTPPVEGPGALEELLR